MDPYTAAKASYRPVPDGPRAYRTKIRASGPLLALVPPALLGLAGIVLLRGNTTLPRGIGGFLAALFAAPVLPIVGAPFRSDTSVLLVGVGLSAVVWFVIGVVAARRATRSPIATWRDFWGQYSWLAAGVWCGVLIALVVSNLVLGRALL